MGGDRTPRRSEDDSRPEGAAAGPGRDGPPVGARELVVRLSSEDPDAPDAPERLQARAEALLERTAEISGESPDDVHIFAHMQSLVVRGPRAFLQALLDQPEVEGAVENREGKNGDETRGDPPWE